MDVVRQNVHGHSVKEIDRTCPIQARDYFATAKHALHKDNAFPAFPVPSEEKAIIETIHLPYVYNWVRRT